MRDQRMAGDFYTATNPPATNVATPFAKGDCVFRTIWEEMKRRCAPL